MNHSIKKDGTLNERHPFKSDCHPNCWILQGSDISIYDCLAKKIMIIALLIIVCIAAFWIQHGLQSDKKGGPLTLAQQEKWLNDRSTEMIASMRGQLYYSVSSVSTSVDEIDNYLQIGLNILGGNMGLPEGTSFIENEEFVQGEFYKNLDVGK